MTASELPSCANSPQISSEEGEYDWDSTVQGAILGSFYWCYILSQVVEGMLTQKFRTNAVPYLATPSWPLRYALCS
ncbi:hypothetical protein J6590_093844 [Homalodisca vitripennis]|nr:hypothetical protein J6590_093844 [Homalodisca vitripennis]